MVKKKSPSRTCKKKKTPKQTASDDIVKAILESSIEPTMDNLVLSKAYQTLRAYDVKAQRTVEVELINMAKRCKEKFLRAVTDEIVESSTLRVADISTIINYIANDLATLPLWDKEHATELDDIFMSLEPQESTGEDKDAEDSKAKDIFKALGESCKEEDGECDCD